MAKRGTSKHKSVAQEEHIASLYEGQVSPSSGAASNDSGDVRAPFDLIECKVTGGPGQPIKRPKLLQEFHKIAEEAYAEGRAPVLALRFYDPDSPLSDMKGWIDLSIRTSEDDAERAKLVCEAHAAAVSEI